MNTEGCGRKQLWHNHDTTLKFVRLDLKIIKNSSVRVASDWQTDWVIQQSGVLLEKLTALHLIGEFLTFCGTWGLITMFTRAYHLFLSWARCIQFTPCNSISLTSVLKLCTHLCLGLPSGFLHSPHNIFSVMVGCKFHLLPSAEELELEVP